MTPEAESTPGIGAILIIDDDKIFRSLLKTLITKLFPGTRIEEYDPSVKGAPAADFPWADHGLLIMDYDLGNGQNGLDWLHRYREQRNFPATIILTARGSEEVAVDAMRFGAQDYINKQKLSIDRLGEAIRNALDKRQRQKQLVSTLSLQSATFNKVHFYKKLADVIKQQDGDNHAFLLQIAIDAYPAIYEQHGMLITDNYISHVTEWLGNLLKSDRYKVSIARIGDALIACLVTGCAGADEGEKIAKTLCAKPRPDFTSGAGGAINSSFSIGISAIAGNASVELILTQTDRACRAAGKKSGDSYTLFGETVAAGTSAAAPAPPPPPPPPKPTLDLAAVVKQNRIQPYYHPCIALSEAASAFESNYFQLRANIIGDDNTILTLQDLKNVEISNGHPGLLDRWLIRHGLGQALPIKKNNSKRKLGLFVRLSTESIGDNKLHEWIKNMITKINTPGVASCLVFEIRPLDFVSHKDLVMKFIKQMRDSWGTGFALHDIVKPAVLDACVNQGGFEFVCLSMDPSRLALLKEISAHCRKLGVLTVLEGINDTQALNFAIEAGIDFGQGDFIQPALEEIALNNEVIKV